MHFHCSFCTVALHHFNAKRVKRSVQSSIIVCFHHSVLGSLSDHLCSVNNATDQIQLDSFINLIDKRGYKIRVDSFIRVDFAPYNIIGSPINGHSFGAVITGQLTLYGFCLGYSGISIGSGCRGVIQCGNKNNVVLCNILIDVVVLDLNAADAVVERNLFVVYRSNPSQLRLNHVGSGDISILVADKLNGVGRNSLQLVEFFSDTFRSSSTRCTFF